MPFCHEWDEAKTLPKALFEKASAAGWLPVCVGAWPTVRSLSDDADCGHAVAVTANVRRQLRRSRPTRRRMWASRRRSSRRWTTSTSWS
jgi:hypothetical protein